MKIDSIPGRFIYAIPAILFLTFIAPCMSVHAEQAAPPHVGEKPSDGSFPLVTAGVAADVFVSADDWKVARIAANDLTADVERVTGRKPLLKESADGLSAQAVLVGTIGRSPVIDGLIKAGRLKVDGVRNQWESFLIEVVENPLPGVKQGLVIAGSDRRGTAYGVYELSKRIGVSPWYWWADVTPVHRAELHVSPERLQVGPPAVKYRGIFINDEMWGIRPWAEKTLAPDEGHGPRSQDLRARSSSCCCACAPTTSGRRCTARRFPSIAIRKTRSSPTTTPSSWAPATSSRCCATTWPAPNGTAKAAASGTIRKIPPRSATTGAGRLAANGRYENIYTLGMRGKDDEPMKFTGTRQEKIALMEQIFADQRDLIAKHVNPDPAKVPQVFIPYTEVLGLYDSGMKVPGRRDDLLAG